VPTTAQLRRKFAALRPELRQFGLDDHYPDSDWFVEASLSAGARLLQDPSASLVCERCSSLTAPAPPAPLSAAHCCAVVCCSLLRRCLLLTAAPLSVAHCCAVVCCSLLRRCLLLSRWATPVRAARACEARLPQLAAACAVGAHRRRGPVGVRGAALPGTARRRGPTRVRDGRHVQEGRADHL
jgi:hypothetical protein